MNKVAKLISYIAFVVVFCCIGIGYAAVQDTLLVNGTVSVDSFKFDANTTYWFATTEKFEDNGKEVLRLRIYQRTVDPNFGVGKYYNDGTTATATAAETETETETGTGTVSGPGTVSNTSDGSNYLVEGIYSWPCGQSNTVPTLPYPKWTTLAGTLNNKETAVVTEGTVAEVIVVDEIDPDDLSSWFAKFTKCTKFDLGKLITSNATTMARMFFYCKSFGDSGLIGLNIDTASAKTIAEMFRGCQMLQNANGTTIKFSNSQSVKDDFDPSNVALTNVRGLFRGCAQPSNSPDIPNPVGLEKVDLTDLYIAPTGVNLSCMFAYCEKLTSVTFPSRAVKGFSGNGTDNGTYYMFADCRALTQVDISFIKCNSTSASQMFVTCQSLTTIYVDKGFSRQSTSASNINMFDTCTLLVGGNGTSYAQSGIVNSSYAVVDGVDGSPGYLTCIVQPKLRIDGVTWSFSNVSEKTAFAPNTTSYIILQGISAGSSVVIESSNATVENKTLTVGADGVITIPDSFMIEKGSFTIDYNSPST